MNWAQIFANFLMLALFYSLIALGLALIFGVMEVLNFAHGQMYMLGGFVVYYFYGQYHFNFFVALILCGIFLGALGLLFERFLFRRVGGVEKVTGTGSFLLAIGTALFLEEGALRAFGEKGYGVPSIFSDIISLGTASIPGDRLMVIILSVLLILALIYFMKSTKMGQAMRALTQDREAAALQGINVHQLSGIGFGLGAALAGIAGGLMVPVLWISAGCGGPMTMKVFIIMLIGGFGSIPGAIAGGFFMGFLEAFGRAFFPGEIVMLVAYSMVVLVLLFRPRGLMGQPLRE